MAEIRIRRFKELEYSGKEAINTLCTNLFFAGGDYKKIMITSCHPEEGKSFVAMNLMRSLAKLGMRVVLVDADIRASSLQSSYGIAIDYAGTDKSVGLTRYLAGGCSMESILMQTDIPNAWMVLAGKLVNNSLPLLNTPRMKNLLDSLAKSFDVVLIDTPPVGTVIDAARIATVCDGILFVIKSESVRPYEFQSAMRQISKTGTPFLGTVLNQFDDRKYGSKYYYYDSYYNNDSLKPEKEKRKGVR